MIDNFFLDDNIAKINISLNLYDSVLGPHKGIFHEPYLFYIHDLGHYAISQRVLSNENNQDSLEIWKRLYINARKKRYSYDHRFMSFILWHQINEGKSKLVYLEKNRFMEDVIDRMKKLLQGIENTIGIKKTGVDEFDFRFGIRYLLRANDFNDLFGDTSLNVFGDMIYIEDLDTVPSIVQIKCIFRIFSNIFLEIISDKI